MELSSQPVPAEYRIRLAIELIYAGEAARALAQAQLVQPTPNISDEDCYNLACIYSRSATNLRNNQGLPSDQRANLVESHISSSLRWLKAAAETGIFGKPEWQDQAKKDSDLDILRDRPEFRQLIESNGAKS